MKRRHLATHVAFAVIVTSIGAIGLGAAQPARAADDQSYTAEELWDLNNAVVTTIEQGSETTQANCKSRYVIARATFAGGALAYQIRLTGNWCWRRGLVTSFSWAKSFTMGGQYYNTWRWVGWVNTVNGGGVGKTHVYRRITAQVRSCAIPPLPVICNDNFPWASMTLRGDGTSTADGDKG